MAQVPEELVQTPDEEAEAEVEGVLGPAHQSDSSWAARSRCHYVGLLLLFPYSPPLFLPLLPPNFFGSSDDCTEHYWAARSRTIFTKLLSSFPTREVKKEK